jgi:polygalacturonase
VGIGSETSGGIKNIVISNCVFNQSYRGLRIKSARGRGNVVKNVRATNIIMDHVGTAISLDMFCGQGEEEKGYQPVTLSAFCMNHESICMMFEKYIEE